MAHALRRSSHGSDNPDNLGRISANFTSTTVTDELTRITNLLRTIVSEGTIGFEFDGRLQVNIDLRKREDVLVLQAVLPTIEAGLFRNLALGNTPNRSFGHRISAEVAR